MIRIELTVEEANALVNLLDISVKSGGLRVASVAVALAQKIEQAAQTQNNSQTENR